MNIILLSGGSGKRLWPLSNEVRSKQFLKIFKTEYGYESMLQRIARQIKGIIPDAKLVVAASRKQVSAIKNQLGENIEISLEPCYRDTFPAIALAAAFLRDVKKVDLDEPIIVCPVDPYVEFDYFEALKKLSKKVVQTQSNLILLGIQPTYPSEKYGYIIQQDGWFQGFKEKPDKESAQKYIEKGALWNGGVFACKLRYALEKSHEQLSFGDYQDLFDKYQSVKKISFDYAVLEKESNIEVMAFAGQWKDMGTWNTLTEAMTENSIGKNLMNENCRNVHIINELEIPILAMGLHDVVISASPDGILVSDKEQSSYIQPLVDQLNQQIRFAEKSWGSFCVLDEDDGSMTIKISLNPGHSMNYHSHKNRDEVWVVTAGQGRTIVDGMEHLVKRGDVLTMQRGCRHTVVAETVLKLIEVQLGKDITVEDKQKCILSC